VRICRNFGVLSVLTAGISLPAQTLLTLPEDSQRAVAMQRVGLTDITITYHRPLVNGRKIWGGLVPYGQVWRAGANENTTIQFSDAVTVEGQPLAKGIYGLHMIPGTDAWTVVFSKAAGDWGSFAYNQKDDALRVTIKPQATEAHEALTYDFEDLKGDSVAATLRWEKVAAPFRIVADLKQGAVDNLRAQLRGGSQYFWEGPAEAADYCLQSKTDLDQGLKWAEQSIQAEDRFENEMTKSQLLAALNRAPEAAKAHDRAMEIGNPPQLYQFARRLQIQEKKQDEAMAVFRIIVKRAPDGLAGHMAQGRLYSAAGNFEGALKEVKTAQALPGNSDTQVKALDPLIQRLQNKQDINQ
jgi:Protein of unknown function (DUF2911)